MTTKYFAFVTTNQPSIQPLEGCETFEAANDMVEGMQAQGEIVPWIFGIEDLENMLKTIATLFGVTNYEQVVKGAAEDIADAANEGHPIKAALDVFLAGLSDDIQAYIVKNNLINPA